MAVPRFGSTAIQSAFRLVNHCHGTVPLELRDKLPRLRRYPGSGFSTGRGLVVVNEGACSRRMPYGATLEVVALVLPTMIAKVPPILASELPDGSGLPEQATAAGPKATRHNATQRNG